MIRQDIQELKTGPRDLRKFGLTVGGVFALLGTIMWLRGKPHFPWFLIPGSVLVLFGLIAPRVLKAVYLGWMSAAIVLGFVVSNIILTLLFLLVITPVGWAARLFGKDFLRLKLDRQSSTYWLRREPTARSKAEYEQQF